MIAADTSVLVAAFASWHQAHDLARAALEKGVRVPTHAALEAYSVLTRLPPSLRVAADLVADWLDRQFPDPWLPSPDQPRALVKRLADVDIVGGSVYDALVAETCRASGATLLTRDARARRIYDMLDVEYQLVT